MSQTLAAATTHKIRALASFAFCRSRQALRVRRGTILTILTRPQQQEQCIFQVACSLAAS